ncbi:hypothetical protein M0R45_005808 [Rubus argutus]|uniref:Uncharacterized protein n=1 Tax=Rubus argutus TaxID=59490 RepID=A0AAW1YNU9_RUBAR
MDHRFDECPERVIGRHYLMVERWAEEPHVLPQETPVQDGLERILSDGVIVIFPQPHLNAATGQNLDNDQPQFPEETQEPGWNVVRRRSRGQPRSSNYRGSPSSSHGPVRGGLSFKDAVHHGENEDIDDMGNPLPPGFYNVPKAILSYNALHVDGLAIASGSQVVHVSPDLLGSTSAMMEKDEAGLPFRSPKKRNRDMEIDGNISDDNAIDAGDGIGWALRCGGEVNAGLGLIAAAGIRRAHAVVQVMMGGGCGMEESTEMRWMVAGQWACGGTRGTASWE